MSSRELLVIIRHLPGDSEFKKAVGPDGWSDNERVAALSANTLSEILRATSLAAGGDDYEPARVLSPLEQREMAYEEAAFDETRDDFMNQAFGL